MLKQLIRNPLFRFFASLKLAVFSLLTLAGVLATATAFESLYGTRGAKVLVYGTWWFGGVLFILGLNVTCAALSRYPWKRHQTGFVVTHLGIITILIGSFLTQQWGVDGNLPVVEGQESADVIMNDLVLNISDENGRQNVSIPFPESAHRKEGRLLEVQLSDRQKLVVKEFIPRAVFERKMTKSPLPGVGMPAMHVELGNSRFRVDEWLQPQHPETPLELNLGPAVLSFRKLWTSTQEKDFLNPEVVEKKTLSSAGAEKTGKSGYIIAEYKGKEYRFDVRDALKGWRRLGSSAIELKVERYLPYAIVDNNELVNKSEEPANPAAQLVLKDAVGTQEKHTVFANFPEFSTLHRRQQKADQKPLGVKLRMLGPSNGQAPVAEGPAGGMVRGQLQFAQTADNGKLLYLVKGKNGEVKGKGEIKVGEPVVTGWMDLRFTVLDWIDSAVEDETPRYVEYIQGGDGNFLTGLRIQLEESGGKAKPANASISAISDAVAADSQSNSSLWLMEGASKPVAVGDKEVFVQFGKSRMQLPFNIHLDKFKVGTDPGTSKAATYESRVTVNDVIGGDTKSQLISMNEPMKYGGYTFYQASYQMDEGRPPVSIFSVNYDPGRSVKYIGSLVMVFGIILMFWLNPHYVGKMLGRKKEEAA